MRNNKCYLKSSRLNSKFVGEHLSFDQYIAMMRNIILYSRVDLHKDNANQIIIANSPFSWESSQPKIRNGILLIHGLFDSPFYLRDLGSYFKQQEFLVRAVLLPGHGTVPGDLLNIDYREWIKAAEFGLRTLAKDVDNIYILGYSLGGALAINLALDHPHLNIKGLFLLAPALKPRSYAKNLIAKYFPLFSWISSRAKWYQIRESENFAKYSCYPLNAGHQACKLITLIEQKLKTKNISVPIFTIISADDETVADEAIVSFFLAQPNANNKLLIYGNEKKYHHSKIIQRNSHYPDLKIINFSHICIAISPNNPLLGEKGQLIESDLDMKNPSNEIYLGAITKKNTKSQTISRLSYNPDFKNMLKEIDNFLVTLN